MRQSESAVSTAPTTTRRGGGTSASAKSSAPSSSTIVWLRSAEMASCPAVTIACISSSGASPLIPSSVTKRCSPAWSPSITVTRAERAATGVSQPS